MPNTSPISTDGELKVLLRACSTNTWRQFAVEHLAPVRGAQLAPGRAVRRTFVVSSRCTTNSWHQFVVNNWRQFAVEHLVPVRRGALGARSRCICVLWSRIHPCREHPTYTTTVGCMGLEKTQETRAGQARHTHMSSASTRYKRCSTPSRHNKNPSELRGVFGFQVHDDFLDSAAI